MNCSFIIYQWYSLSEHDLPPEKNGHNLYCLSYSIAKFFEKIMYVNVFLQIIPPESYHIVTVVIGEWSTFSNFIQFLSPSYLILTYFSPFMLSLHKWSNLSLTLHNMVSHLYKRLWDWSPRWLINNFWLPVYLSSHYLLTN